MLKWLVSKVRWIWRVIIMKAQYWTALAAMALPLGVSLIALSVVFPDLKTWLMYFGFASMIVGFIFSIVGWVYTIKEDHRRDSKDEEERQQRIKDDLKNQQEHDEIIAILASSKLRTKMSSPRLIRLIERIRELRGTENE